MLLEKKQIEMAELKQQEQSKFVSKDQQIDVLNNDLEQLALVVLINLQSYCG